MANGYWQSGGGVSSGGSGGGGGGSDRTAVTVEADPVNGGERIAIETLNGIPVTYGYDVYGRLSTRSWSAGGLLATINYADNTTGIASSVSGNRFVRGDYWMVTVSQMATLKTALIALGAMDETPTFYVEDLDSGRGVALEWDAVNQGYRGIGGSPWLYKRVPGDVHAAWTGSTSESSAQYTLSIPAWVNHLNSAILAHGGLNAVGTGGTKTINLKYAGTTFGFYAVSSGQLSASVSGRLQNTGALNTNSYASGRGAYDGNGGSSASFQSSALNTGSDQDFTVTCQLGNSADSVRLRDLEIWIVG